MVWAAEPWSPFLVFSERMMQAWFIRFAICGISSLMATPGTLVLMARNGPPVAAPGLGSNVSSWLAPPASHSRMTRFCCCFSSFARAGSWRTFNAVIAAAVPTALVRKPRRSMACSAEPQKVLRMVMVSAPYRSWGQTSRSARIRTGQTSRSAPTSDSIVEPELRAAEQRPDDLFVRLAGLVALLRDVVEHRLLLLVAGRPAHGRAIGQLDRLLGRLGVLHLAQQRPGVLRQQLALEAVAVAEEQ